MLTLYDRTQHELLPERPWSSEEARGNIRSIVRDAEAAWNPVTWWPQHPDEQSGTDEPLSIVYCGAAGVVWALDYLRRMGHSTDFDLAAAAQVIASKTLQEAPEYPWIRTSYLVGDLGVLALMALLFDDTNVHELLRQRIEASLSDSALELFAGIT